MSNKLLGNLPQGLLFVVSAPAGTGKTTLAHMLCDEFEAIVISVSCTTRVPRPHEVPGVDYHFISPKEFEEKLSSKAFLEHVSIFDHAYGTLHETVEKEQSLGRHVLLVIDTQGHKKICALKAPHISIFIHPPSLSELRHRLEKRGTENAPAIDKRLSFAHTETKNAHLYDYEVVNDHLQTAYQILRSIIIAEEHKRLKTQKESLCQN